MIVTATVAATIAAIVAAISCSDQSLCVLVVLQVSWSASGISNIVILTWLYIGVNYIRLPGKTENHHTISECCAVFTARSRISAKRGITIVSRPSVCSSVSLSVHPSVTLMYRGRVGWTSSKLITRVISLWSSLLGDITSAI